MSETDPPFLGHPLEQIVASQHLGVRVWSVQASSTQQLIDQLAVILGAHG
jgi:hypothetical protein